MEKENEKNQEIKGIAIHDIVVLSKYQKTGDNGEKLGYSFYEKDNIGVVTQVNEDKLVLKLADGEEEVYNVKNEDKEYYYRIGKGSEVEYEKGIKQAIDKLIDQREKKNLEIIDMTQWLYDFKHSISFIGRMARFIKEFN